MTFESPLAFLLLLMIPAAMFLYRRARRGSGLHFSSLKTAKASSVSLRRRLLWLPMLLRICALILLAVVLARPRKGIEKVRDLSKGIAIEMVVDRSGSMQAEMDYDGDTMNRLEVVKHVFAEFVSGNNSGLKGRPNDLIGLISFAGYADTICPLTLGHGAIKDFLKTVKLARRSEDGTAIGDAIALAAARLKTAEEMLQRQNETEKYEIKSKIIILLTDGQSNAGKRLPLKAAELAAEWGIKIYTVGIGGEGGDFFNSFFSGRGVDSATLEAIAQKTGGVFRMADDAKALREIYDEIDRLETSEVTSNRYLDYRERFLPFLHLALAFLAMETLLSCTLFRRIP